MIPLKCFILLREFSQRFRDVGETEDKPIVISASAREVSYFVFILWGRAFPNGLQLLGVGVTHSGDTIYLRCHTSF